ncbi:MAG: hypothetical protein COU35_00155 [Candidatus Magasanikbacteria bacterium CG10_big_fil_rev_8_21_14_0_10_47_10]|uniref:Uncharacterized protein n=1 Tax=Candidatus Magasanikbacteria bacterium CG10_big_fil_rev_8_21_14_0_10_47_10 TaxID=1974652 RepID=A0A2H0TRT3_9BACT|nr:MAG: hypothetical protein COU35_00155 [Candidatus Magasanikbacteria bacterium CG10_big_fil_rev_8_21_14_0_10_47_10]
MSEKKGGGFSERMSGEPVQLEQVAHVLHQAMDAGDLLIEPGMNETAFTMRVYDLLKGKNVHVAGDDLLGLADLAHEMFAQHIAHVEKAKAEAKQGQVGAGETSKRAKKKNGGGRRSRRGR